MKCATAASLFCVFLMEMAVKAEAIMCYRCESIDDNDCSEKFDKAISRHKPQSCDDIFEAEYCIKATGMYQGHIGTQRFCSSRHHGNYCEYLRRPGDEREYRSCIFTCSRDACNAAYTSSRSLQSLLVQSINLVVILYINIFLSGT